MRLTAKVRSYALVQPGLPQVAPASNKYRSSAHLPAWIGGDGLSETNLENSTPALIEHYSWAQKAACVKSSDIFCMYFLELNFLPVEAPDI